MTVLDVAPPPHPEPTAGPWALIEPAGAAVVELGIGRRVPALAPGATVVVRCGGPGAWFRCRRFARRHHLQGQRSYLVLPSLGRARLRIEDAPEARAWFVANLLTTPPGAGRLSPVVDLVVAVVRLAARGPLLGIVTPGRVVVGSLPGPRSDSQRSDERVRP